MYKLKKIVFVFLLCFVFYINICSYTATVIGPGSKIESTTGTSTEIDTTKPKGFKVENAQYYDYVEYEEQGGIVNKNNIIIGKGSGGSGQGGGSAGNVINETTVDSVISEKGIMESKYQEALDVIKEAQKDEIIQRAENIKNGKEYIQQQSVEEVARQQSIEAELAIVGAKKNQLIESIRQSSMKAEALAKARARAQTNERSTTDPYITENEYEIEPETIQPNDTINTVNHNIAVTETTISNGIRIINHEYYDYIGYDDQGRLVDKNNIIIGKGSDGSGQGGGSTGKGVIIGSSRAITVEEKIEKELLESVQERLSKVETTESIIDDNEKHIKIFDFIRSFFGKITNNKEKLKITLPETPHYVNKSGDAIEIETCEYEVKKNNDRFEVSVKCLVKKISRSINCSFNIKLKNDVDFVVVAWDDWLYGFDDIKVGEMVEKTIRFYDVPYSDSYTLIIE